MVGDTAMTVWRIGRGLVAVVAVCGVAAPSLFGQNSPAARLRPGTWLLPRKDAGNSARADLPGKMPSAPLIWWSYGGGGDRFAWSQTVDLNGKPHAFGLVRTGVRLVRRDGSIVWKNERLGASTVLGVGPLARPGVQALVTIGQTSVVLLDVPTGNILWRWDVPAGAYLGSCKLRFKTGDSRFVCFVQNTLIGVSFRLPGPNGLPVKLWEKTYQDAWWAGYGPQIVLADMDNDHGEEVVVSGKPGYVGVVDLDTGAMRTQLRYPVRNGSNIGRPYGLLHVVDVDGDGFRDVVMVSCQVEEYVGIVRNVAGKSLEPLWSQFVEQDYPSDTRELRPNLTSVADIDGDGRRELVVGLYNVDGDNRWHTVAFASSTGWDKRVVDLPGRFFHGCHDLNGDGVAEIVTTQESSRRVQAGGKLAIVDGRSGKDVFVTGQWDLVIADGHLGAEIGFMAYRASPVFLAGKTGGLLLRSRADGTESVLRLAGAKPSLTRMVWTDDARATALSRFPASTEGIDVRFGPAKRSNAPDIRTVRVGSRMGKPEMLLGLSDNRTVRGNPDWKQNRVFPIRGSQPGGNPSLWIDPAGVPTIITRNDDKNSVWIGRGDSAPREIRLPYPLYVMDPTTSGATLLPFGTERMQLFLGLQTGVHTLACALLDDTGKELWRHDNFGPYPRSAGLLERSGQEPLLVVNDHYNKFVLDLGGKILENMTYGSPRPGGQVLTPYALPICGPFGPGEESVVVFAPGLDSVQVLDSRFAIRATRMTGTYDFEYCGSSIARLRPSEWDLGMANHDGIFHCVDLASGKSRWTVDLGARAPFAHVMTSCDVDGDGRDNFLVGLPDGRLLALDEVGGAGKVLWTVQFPAGVREAYGADVDGDGLSEIVALTDDGQVHVLGPRRPVGNPPRKPTAKHGKR